MDDDRIRLLLEEESCGSSYKDEDDNEVEDHVEVQEDTYDTEQEEDDEATDEEEGSESSRDFYIGKDGKTRWNKCPPANPTRRRARNRWPMVVFYSLMNVAGINTFIIYLHNNPTKNTSRRIFLEALAYDLINPQLRRRALISSLPRTLRLRLTEICKLDGPESSVTSNNNKVGRCGYCSSKKKPQDTLQLRHLQKILLFGTCCNRMP